MGWADPLRSLVVHARSALHPAVLRVIPPPPLARAHVDVTRARDSIATQRRMTNTPLHTRQANPLHLSSLSHPLRLSLSLSIPRSLSPNLRQTLSFSQDLTPTLSLRLMLSSSLSVTHILSISIPLTPSQSHRQSLTHTHTCTHTLSLSKPLSLPPSVVRWPTACFHLPNRFVNLRLARAGCGRGAPSKWARWRRREMEQRRGKGEGEDGWKDEEERGWGRGKATFGMERKVMLSNPRGKREEGEG